MYFDVYTPSDQGPKQTVGTITGMALGGKLLMTLHPVDTCWSDTRCISGKRNWSFNG